MSTPAGPEDPVRPWRERPDCCDVREPLFVVRDLSVWYGRTPALSHVSVDLARGCVTAVVGPSGCGKSSFLACLNRMTDLADGCTVTGSVKLEGTELVGTRLDLVGLRRQVGMIFQRPNPFPLSIRRNLAFPLEQHGVRGRDERDGRVERALREVGLWEEVKDRLDAPALDLSGGQQQRLCLARALVLEPQVLLLDEPCSALDPIAGGVVEDLIASLRGRYTVVIVTHNLGQARRLGDDIAVFRVQEGVGTLIEFGPAGQVFEQPRSEWTAAYVRGDRG